MEKKEPQLDNETAIIRQLKSHSSAANVVFRAPAPVKSRQQEK